MTGRLFAGLAALSLIACAPAPGGPDTPVSSPPDRPAVPEPSLTGPGEDPNDPCEAKRFQHFVGKPWTIVGTPPPNRTWRVFSTTDAVTEDYSPTRMNVMWDAQTGLVKSVTCG